MPDAFVPDLATIVSGRGGKGFAGCHNTSFGTVMPKIGAALDPVEIDIIRAWIATGAVP